MQQVEQESIIAAWLRVSIFETFLSLTPGKILKIFLKRRLKEYEDIKTQIQDLTRDVAQADPTLLEDPDLQPPFKP